MEVHTPQFTDSKRQELRERGRQSVYFFLKGIVGHPDLDVEPHGRLCQALQGQGEWGPAWRKGVISMFRGGLKTTVVQGWLLWRGLYEVNFACKVVMNTDTNAYGKYLKPIDLLFRESRRADFLCWLYEDRLTPGFKGCNSDQWEFVRDDAFGHPFMTYGGVDSQFESYHGNVVVGDDLEGSDAEKGDAKNVNALRAVDSFGALVKDPGKDQIVIVGTPWGQNPLVYSLRNMEAGGSLDNSKRNAWKVFWCPIENENGDPAWPRRFSREVIDYYRNGGERLKFFQSQRLLLPPEEFDTVFDVPQIVKDQYVWLVPRERVKYPVKRIPPHPRELPSEEILGRSPAATLKGGFSPLSDWAYKDEMFTVDQAVADLAGMRIYALVDPKHRDKAKTANATETAEAAITVTGVWFDGHIFVLHCWHKEASIAATVQELFRLDRIYGFYRISVEVVGAQVWFKPYVEALESADSSQVSPYRFPYKMIGEGRIHKLPLLSRRIVETKRGIISKEEIYRERLAPWFEKGLIHLHASQSELKRQISQAMNDKTRKDVLDALSQGPDVWKAPIAGPDYEWQLRERNEAQRQMALRQKRHPWGSVRPGQPAGGRYTSWFRT